MKKHPFLFWSFIVLAAIILLLLIFYWARAPIVSSYLSKKLKTDVSMDNISWSKEHIKIKNFSVKTDDKKGFTSGKINIYYQRSKFPNEFDVIVFEDVFLGVYCDNPVCSENNWTKLMQSIEEKEEQDQKNENIHIKKLVFKNVDVLIQGLGLDDKVKTKHFDEFILNDINSKDGFPTQQIIAALFRQFDIQDYLKDFIKDKKWYKKLFHIDEIGKIKSAS